MKHFQFYLTIDYYSYMFKKSVLYKQSVIGLFEALFKVILTENTIYSKT